MSGAAQLVVTLGPGRRIDAQVEGFTIRTDQPLANGGGGTAPSPFQLFLASIGTCAGIFVQGFCAARGLPYEDIRITERPHFDEAGGLTAVELMLSLPEGFPSRYREALLKVMDQCSVKRAIRAQPTLTARLAETAPQASAQG
jgi:ribosomal protein S12 methylthiotransferase accessory factor